MTNAYVRFFKYARFTSLSIIKILLLSIFTYSGAQTAFANQTITDQLNRSVIIPDKVERVVVLQHQTLDILVQLDATNKIVGVLNNWPELIPGLDHYAPQLDTLPRVGTLTSVNIEEILKLHPDVVFVTNYAPAPMIEQLSQMGIPVVAISLSKGEGIEVPKLNPTFADDDKAYSEGLKDGIALIGAIIDKKNQAKELIDYSFKKRDDVAKRLENIPDDKRIRLYMANPDMSTYGTGKYTGVIMKRSGGINVAGEVKGATKVSMEQVILWNPQVIFVQDRYAPVADEIRNNPQWQQIDAVKNNRIYITPEYVKPWGYPLPEALALGELWMAKKLYPECFEDIDMDKEVNDYYQKFYRTAYVEPQVKN